MLLRPCIPLQLLVTSLYDAPAAARVAPTGGDYTVSVVVFSKELEDEEM